MSHVIFLLNNKLVKLLNDKPSEEKLHQETNRRVCWNLLQSERSVCGSERHPVVGTGSCFLPPQISAGDWPLRLGRGGGADCAVGAHIHTHTLRSPCSVSLRLRPEMGCRRPDPRTPSSKPNQDMSGKTEFSLDFLTFRRGGRNSGKSLTDF